MTEIENQIVQVAEECVMRWGTPDKKTASLSDKVTKWLCNADTNQQKILLELLKNFNYYSKERTLGIFSELLATYKKETSNFGYQVYTYIKSKTPIMNSSINLLSEIYEYEGDIHKGSMIIDISAYFEGKENVKEIVLIDDFIGSGDTIITYMNTNIVHLRGKKIVIIIIEILDTTIGKIKEYCRDNGLELDMFYHCKQVKAFTHNHIFKNEEVLNSKGIIKALEINIWGKENRNILGYAASECLLAFWRNTPNNTLSAFWYEKDSTWKGVFPRKNEDIPQFIKEVRYAKSQRRQRNYDVARGVKK